MPEKSNVTRHGLAQWNKAMYERLGYMFLAKNKGYHDKVKVYKQSIDHLIQKAQLKIKETVNVDRKADLEIILGHAKLLKTFAAKI